MSSPKSFSVVVTANHKSTTEVSTTMKLDNAPLKVLEGLARHLDLPPWVDAQTVQSALACAPPPDQVRAAAAARRPVVRAAAPAPRPAPMLDPANLRASSAEELRSLAASPLATADRTLVGEELSHRQAMATHYPGLHRGDGPRVRYFS